MLVFLGISPTVYCLGSGLVLAAETCFLRNRLRPVTVTQARRQQEAAESRVKDAVLLTSGTPRLTRTTRLRIPRCLRCVSAGLWL